jgi:hypothetical protein
MILPAILLNHYRGLTGAEGGLRLGREVLGGRAARSHRLGVTWGRARGGSVALAWGRAGEAAWASGRTGIGWLGRSVRWLGLGDGSIYIYMTKQMKLIL